MNEVLYVALAVATSMTVSGLVYGWRRRRARKAAATGYLSMRAALRAPADRWLTGVLMFTPGRVTWRCAPGPEVELSALRVLDRRDPTVREALLSFPSGYVVFLCRAGEPRVEIAIPKAYEAAFTRLLPAG